MKFVSMTALLALTVSTLTLTTVQAGEVVWWTPNWGEARAKELAEKFQAANPGITIRMEVTTSDGLPQRVLTALQLADGRVLPVVRGTVGSLTASAPSPPAGTVTQTGVFLPSEARADHTVPPEAMGSVRLPLLAQRWSQPLLPGFITLGRADAVAQGLSRATAVLPTGEGSVQNIGYALQWWVFAAFAVLLTFRFVRTIGRRGDLGTLSEQEDV